MTGFIKRFSLSNCFLITLFLLFPPLPVYAAPLTIVFDRGTYSPGDLVRISVSYTPFMVVSLEVRDPYGNLMFVDEGRTGVDGVAVFTFRLGEEWPEGVYKVYAASGGAKAVSEFKVGRGEVFSEVRVRVVDWSGRPLRGAVLQVGGRGVQVDGETTVFVPRNGSPASVFYMGVEVFNGTVAPEGEAVLRCRVYRLEVRLRDWLGLPLADTRVTLRSKVGVLEAVTDMWGVAVFEQVAPGTYTVQASGIATTVEVVDGDVSATLTTPLSTPGIMVLTALAAAAAVAVLYVLHRKGIIEIEIVYEEEEGGSERQN